MKFQRLLLCWVAYQWFTASISVAADLNGIWLLTDFQCESSQPEERAVRNSKRANIVQLYFTDPQAMAELSAHDYEDRFLSAMSNKKYRAKLIIEDNQVDVKILFYHRAPAEIHSGCQWSAKDVWQVDDQVIHIKNRASEIQSKDFPDVCPWIYMPQNDLKLSYQQENDKLKIYNFFTQLPTYEILHGNQSNPPQDICTKGRTVSTFTRTHDTEALAYWDPFISSSHVLKMLAYWKTFETLRKHCSGSAFEQCLCAQAEKFSSLFEVVAAWRSQYPDIDNILFRNDKGYLAQRAIMPVDKMKAGMEKICGITIPSE